MSALTTLFDTENDALVEVVFVESCKDLINMLDDEAIEQINEYVTLLGDKKTKSSLEQEISEALVAVMENNAALYGTFLYETTGDEISPENVKTMLENIRELFGREFVMEALSDKAKRGLKTAGKVALGVGAAGGAAYAAHKNQEGIGKAVKTGLGKVKDAFSGDKPESEGQAVRKLAAAENKMALNKSAL